MAPPAKLIESGFVRINLRHRGTAAVAMLIVVVLYVLYHEFNLDDGFYRAKAASNVPPYVRVITYSGAHLLIGFLGMRARTILISLISSLLISTLPMFCEAILRPREFQGAMGSPFIGIAMGALVLISLMGMLVSIMPMTIAYGITVWTRNRAQSWIRTGHCESCGYDLTGNISGICSECGTPINTLKSAPETPWDRIKKIKLETPVDNP